MTQQKSGYSIDYSKGSADAGKDRLREMADVAIDKMKEVTRAPSAKPITAATPKIAMGWSFIDFSTYGLNCLTAS